ncbi:hypothetical protein FRC04_003400 [Tulasnella sp. 424]|nr:hypothetical protein FRC04_003400 [Tulasnella sp. 424]KAG8977212.1 hypothetical protein FRC05_002212 [Tulasnella sp. 425]
MQHPPQDIRAGYFFESFRLLWGQDLRSDDDHQAAGPFMENIDDLETSPKPSVRHEPVPHLHERNAGLPISKLPPELLQQIFYFTLFTSSGNRRHQYISMISILRSVSWAWRELVDGTPFLWSHISSSDPPDFVSAAFYRSKQSPLHLQYADSDDDGPESAFLDRALTGLHRWVSLSIGYAKRVIFANYFTTPQPRLKKMRLISSGPWDSDAPVRLFGGSWTSLEELHINWSGVLDWSEVQCGRLRVAEIGPCGGLSLPVIIGIIQENQRLEVLKLDSITFSSSPPPYQRDSPIVLSHLRALTLASLDTQPQHPPQCHPTYYILRHIQFPSCTEFIINTSMASRSTSNIEEFMNILPSPLNILTRSPPDPPSPHPTARSLEANFSASEFCLTTGERAHHGVRYKVVVSYAPRAITRRWLHGTLGSDPIEPIADIKLFIYIGGHHLQLEDIAYFQEWEAVTHLSIQIHAWHRQDEVESRLVRMLSTPYTSASGAAMMPFPRLRCIEAHLWAVPGEAVIEMIRKRFSTPGIGISQPEIIIIDSRNGKMEFLWPDLDGIREIDLFHSISFGPTSNEPPGSQSPDSLESD